MPTNETPAHTPGPWQLDFERHYCGSGTPERRQARAVKAGRKVIAAVLCKWRAHDPQSDADARLIASAPALLENLQMMVRAFNVREVDPIVAFIAIEKANAALAKAGARP